MSATEGLRRRRPPSDHAVVADAGDSSDGESTLNGGVDDEVAVELVPSEVLDRSFRRAVAGSALVWACLYVAAMAFAPSESFKPQASNGASLALGATSLIMAVSVVTRSLALLFVNPFQEQHPRRHGELSHSVDSRISGVALAGFFVQACSAVTNGTMALFPTPMLVDPVTGMEVCLLRWCEWAPLSFLMAFLTASMDADDSNGGIRRALQFALCQGISTLCGLLFPLLKPGLIWWLTMVAAVLLHATLHPLLLSKTVRMVSLLPSFSAAELKRRDRTRVAAQLIQLLTVAWTLLVLFYFLAWFLQVSPATNAMLECSVEVLSKHLYLNYLLDAHRLIFYSRRRVQQGLVNQDDLSDDKSSCDDSSSGGSTMSANQNSHRNKTLRPSVR